MVIKYSTISRSGLSFSSLMIRTTLVGNAQVSEQIETETSQAILVSHYENSYIPRTDPINQRHELRPLEVQTAAYLLNVLYVSDSASNTELCCDLALILRSGRCA